MKVQWKIGPATNNFGPGKTIMHRQEIAFSAIPLGVRHENKSPSSVSFDLNDLMTFENLTAMEQATVLRKLRQILVLER